MNSFKKNYADLEHQILVAIAAGKNRHVLICGDPGVKEKAAPFVTEKFPMYRVIDNRTQALRQRGLLSFDSKEGWRKTSV